VPGLSYVDGVIRHVDRLASLGINNQVFSRVIIAQHRLVNVVMFWTNILFYILQVHKS
jgi:hypothetical protein